MIACLADTNARNNAYTNLVKPRHDIIATTSTDQGLGKTVG